MPMHPETLAALLAAIRAELVADPSQRGYAGKSAAEIASLMNDPVVVAQAPVYRDVPVSSVEGYMRLRTHIVRLKRWVDSTEVSQLRDFAEEMLDMIAAGKVGVFETSDDAKRPAILGAFAGLAAVGAGGFNAQSVADLTAMTLAPPGPPVVQPPRWGAVIDGISGVGNDPGPPNAATEALVQEAINGGG
jgi:hypothetical protein